MKFGSQYLASHGIFDENNYNKLWSKYI